MARRTRSSPPAAEPAAPRSLPAGLVAAGVAALHLVLCLLALDPGGYLGGDNGAYVALARGLLERGAYLDYWDPALRPHTQYPPVFPLILAVGLRAGLSVWVGLKLLCIALSAAAVALAALWLRRVLPPTAALVAAVLVAAVPGTLPLAAQVLSDVPFWTWTMLALWAYARAEDDEGGRGWEALGAAAIVLAFFTRSAGLPLAVAACAWLLLRRRWRGLAMLLVTLGPLALAWWLRTRANGGSSAYAREFWWINPYAPSLGTIGPLDLLARIGENLGRYGGWHLPTLFFGYDADVTPLRVAVAVAVVVLAVVGWGMRARRPGVPELFLPLYVGLLLVWPATWAGERFLLPILPALIGYAAVALLRAAELRRWARPLPVAAAALLAVVLLGGIRAQARLGAVCRAEYAAGSPAPCLAPEWSQLLASGSLIRGRLPEGSVVIHRKPTLFFVSSGYRSRLYPKSEEPDSFFALAREIGARYVVLDQIADMSPYLAAVVRARIHQFCVVEELSYPYAVLARIVPDAPPMPPGSAPDAIRVCPVTPRGVRNPPPP